MTSFDLRIEADGTGCASVPSEAYLALAVATALDEVESAVSSPVEMLGVRYLDADGRDTELPVTGGLALIGFRTAGR